MWGWTRIDEDNPIPLNGWVLVTVEDTEDFALVRWAPERNQFEALIGIPFKPDREPTHWQFVHRA